MGDKKERKVFDIQAFRNKQDQPVLTQVSGEAAKLSGIYHLQHPRHPVAKELVILKGSKFPSCPACSQPITFKLIRQANEIADDPDFV